MLRNRTGGCNVGVKQINRSMDEYSTIWTYITQIKIT